MRRLIQTIGTVAAVLAAAPAPAALFVRPGGMVYDDVLKVTWLSDWNYAKTSGVSADGRMNWPTANNWANNLVYGGYSDWRLPITVQPDTSCSEVVGDVYFGFNCTGSEYGHMAYINWGATAENDFSLGTNTDNLALFSNVQSWLYWSGTELPQDPGYAWFFNTADVQQGIGAEYDSWFAVAVRPGDVAPMPEPQTAALVLLALGLAAVVRRKSS